MILAIVASQNLTPRRQVEHYVLGSWSGFPGAVAGSGAPTRCLVHPITRVIFTPGFIATSVQHSQLRDEKTLHYGQWQTMIILKLKR